MLAFKLDLVYSKLKNHTVYIFDSLHTNTFIDISRTDDSECQAQPDVLVEPVMDIQYVTFLNA